MFSTEWSKIWPSAFISFFWLRCSLEQSYNPLCCPDFSPKLAINPWKLGVYIRAIRLDQIGRLRNIAVNSRYFGSLFEKILPCAFFKTWQLHSLNHTSDFSGSAVHIKTTLNSTQGCILFTFCPFYYFSLFLSCDYHLWKLE